jgi:hypothetical protein
MLQHMFMIKLINSEIDSPKVKYSSKLLVWVVWIMQYQFLNNGHHKGELSNLHVENIEYSYV